MRKGTFVVMLAVLLAGLWVPSAAFAQGKAGTVDLIIQTDGSTDALVAKVRSLGGIVKIVYRNVPAVAVTLPADQVSAVSEVAGVTYVQKDSMVYLTDKVSAPKPMYYAVEDATGAQLEAVDPATISSGALPENYANFLYTGAIDVWDTGNFGAGSIVAVVDTGVTPNVCLENAVIGAPGYPDGYNAVGDGIPATSPDNYWHGTHVAGIIASSCALTFTGPPYSALYTAINTYLPWGTTVPIFGQAPEAQIYPVKVFPTDGSGVARSVILDGLDHVLTLKKDGLLDIDIVNMSLSGPTVWDGHDAYQAFLQELNKAGVLVVTSAGNEGPTPNSLGTPAASFEALSVGALDYALSSRILYEYLGLRYLGVAGQGMVMRPTEETRVVNFSSRGPLSDARVGPEIAALGQWNFAVGPKNELRWAGGTSFSAPTVAGAAALLNSYWEGLGNETDPVALENALLGSADPSVVGPAWQGVNDQGYGVLNVLAALAKLESGDTSVPPKMTLPLLPNALGLPIRGHTQTWSSGAVTLAPSEPFNANFLVGWFTSKVTIHVYDIVAPDNSEYAYWPNALEVHLQSATRTGAPHPVAIYWYPSYGDSFDIVVEDGPWTVAGEAWAYQPMQQGIMKLALIGDYSNESPVSFKVDISVENNRRPSRNRIARGRLQMADQVLVPVDIPEGTTEATFDLRWLRDWMWLPTSDIDMIIFDPTFALASLDGATFNAPERAVISSPTAGTWYVLIDAYEVYKPDIYQLSLTLK